jgi:NO-binding membrane sensor protein with MHYT domain
MVAIPTLFVVCIVVAIVLSWVGLCVAFRQENGRESLTGR